MNGTPRRSSDAAAAPNGKHRSKGSDFMDDATEPLLSDQSHDRSPLAAPAMSSSHDVPHLFDTDAEVGHNTTPVVSAPYARGKGRTRGPFASPTQKRAGSIASASTWSSYGRAGIGGSMVKGSLQRGPSVGMNSKLPYGRGKGRARGPFASPTHKRAGSIASASTWSSYGRAGKGGSMAKGSLQRVPSVGMNSKLGSTGDDDEDDDDEDDFPETTKHNVAAFTEMTNLSVPSSRVLKCIFIVSFVFFVLGLVFAIFDSKIRIQSVDFPANDNTFSGDVPPFPPRNESTNLTLPSSWWFSERIEFKQTSLYLYLGVIVSRTGNILPQVERKLEARVLMSVYEDEHTHEFDTFTTLTLQCAENSVNCSSLSIFSPYGNVFAGNWQDEIANDFEKSGIFNVTVVYFEDDLRNPDHLVSYQLISSRESYKLAEIICRSVFIAITAGALLWWLYRFTVSGWVNVIPEQWWMVCMFLALLLYQDPLTVSAFASPTNRLIAACTFAGSSVAFLTFWVTMMSGINEISKGKHTFNFHFYQWKIVWFAIILASALTFLLLAVQPEDPGYFQEAVLETEVLGDVWIALVAFMVFVVMLLTWIGWLYAPGDDDLSEAVLETEVLGDVWIALVAFMVFVVMLLFWIGWFCVKTRQATKSLQKLPYLQTRARQLAFRFFKTQTLYLFIYFVIFETIWFAYGAPLPSILDSYNTHLGNVFVFSIYVYSISFLYLPSTHKSLREEFGDFSLATARYLCDMAWQAYLQAPGSPILEASKGWGLLDTPQHHQMLLGVGDNVACDSHFIITRGVEDNGNKHADPDPPVRKKRGPRKLLNVLERKKSRASKGRRSSADSKAPLSTARPPATSSKFPDEPPLHGKLPRSATSPAGVSSGAIFTHRAASCQTLPVATQPDDTVDIVVSPSDARDNPLQASMSPEPHQKLSPASIHSPPCMNPLPVPPSTAKSNGSSERRSREHILHREQSAPGGSPRRFHPTLPSLSALPRFLSVFGNDEASFDINAPGNEDTHKSHNDITIAFRGTLSLTNVQFDLKFSRVNVPGRYWFGDSAKRRRANGSEMPEGHTPSSHTSNNRRDARASMNINKDPSLEERKEPFVVNNGLGDLHIDDSHFGSSGGVPGGRDPLQGSRYLPQSAPPAQSAIAIHDNEDLGHDPNEILSKDRSLDSNLSDPNSHGITNGNNSLRRAASAGDLLRSGGARVDQRDGKKPKASLRRAGSIGPGAIDHTATRARATTTLQAGLAALPGRIAAGVRDNVPLPPLPISDFEAAKAKLVEWVNDFRDLPNYFLSDEGRMVQVPDVKIHGGFWGSYTAVRDQLFEQIETILEDARRSDRKLRWFVTGHSLGGAMATLCALEMKLHLRLEPHVYLYGCPRVGSHGFARLYDRLVPRTYRVVTQRDVVPTFPKFISLYKHVGKEFMFDQLGSVITDPSWVEKQLLPSRSSIADHQLSRYRNGLETACVMRGFMARKAYEPVFAPETPPSPKSTDSKPAKRNVADDKKAAKSKDTTVKQAPSDGSADNDASAKGEDLDGESAAKIDDFDDNKNTMVEDTIVKQAAKDDSTDDEVSAKDEVANGENSANSEDPDNQKAAKGEDADEEKVLETGNRESDVSPTMPPAITAIIDESLGNTANNDGQKAAKNAEFDREDAPSSAKVASAESTVFSDTGKPPVSSVNDEDADFHRKDSSSSPGR